MSQGQGFPPHAIVAKLLVLPFTGSTSAPFAGGSPRITQSSGSRKLKGFSLGLKRSPSWNHYGIGVFHLLSIVPS